MLSYRSSADPPGKSHRAVFVLKDAINGRASGSNIEVVLEQLHGGSHLIGRPRISFTAATPSAADVPVPAELEAILKTDAGQRTADQRRALARTFLKESNASELAKLPEAGKVFAVASQFDAIGNFKPPNGPRSFRSPRAAKRSSVSH